MAQEIKLKRYVSKERGKRLAFGPDKKYLRQRRLIGSEAPMNISNPELKSVIFQASATKMYLDDAGEKHFYSIFETNNPVIQTFIEASQAFKTGLIFNEPTPEEMAEKKAIAEQRKLLEKYRSDYQSGLLGEIDEKRNPESLKRLANLIGIEVKDKKSGKELTPKQLASKIVELLSVKPTPESQSQAKDTIVEVV